MIKYFLLSSLHILDQIDGHVLEKEKQKKGLNIVYGHHLVPCRDPQFESHCSTPQLTDADGHYLDLDLVLQPVLATIN